MLFICNRNCCREAGDEAAAASPAAKSVDESVMDWVRRQAAMTEASAAIGAPPESAASAPDAASGQQQQQQEGGGEVFDSGTESGEDSTTQSNHSQSDLNAFMADLARLSIDTPGSNRPPVNLNSSPQEFLRQVDSVLDRLKSSLKTGEGADQALHQHAASGDKQLKIQPNEQSELISLIDRLQTSLHHLRSDSPPPQPIEVKLSTPLQTVPPAVQAAQQSTPQIEVFEEKATQRKEAEEKEAEKSRTSARGGVSAVKLRAQSFAAAVSSKPAALARPSSFYRSPVSSGSSVRSSSEPASPNPSPLPHKVQLKAPDFLAGASVQAPVSHRPIWCQVQPASQHSKIVLEKSGIRGRFVPPELNPVPVPEKKSPVHQVQPAVSLHRIVAPSVRSQSQPPLQRLQLTQQPTVKPQTAPPEPESPVQSPKTPNPNKNLPWKVKLAKKKQASNASVVRPLDGSTSVDLRNTIKLAAHRKSTEDLSTLKSQPTTYPLLKQKSLGELYSTQPKPFVRSESVGAHDKRGVDLFKPVDLKKLNFTASRSSSTDRASDWSTSAPPTPLSPEAPVVVSASIGPSASGSWVMTSTSKKPVAKQESTSSVPEAIAKQEPVASSGSDFADDAPQVVTGVLKLGQKEPSPMTRKASINDLNVDPSAELFTPAEMLQIAIHRAAIKASLVQQEEDRKKLTSVPSSPVSKSSAQAAESAPQPPPVNLSKPVENVNGEVKVDEAVEKTAVNQEDASSTLFTPGESMQIAMDQVATKASLDRQEEARKKTERSCSLEVPQSPVSLTGEEPLKSPKSRAPPDDPSAILFTPAESLQIAIHKAAIKASLTQQEEARKKSIDASPDSLSLSSRSRSSRSDKSKSKSSSQKASAKPLEQVRAVEPTPVAPVKSRLEARALETKAPQSRQPAQDAKLPEVKSEKRTPEVQRKATTETKEKAKPLASEPPKQEAKQPVQVQEVKVSDIKAERTAQQLVKVPESKVTEAPKPSKFEVVQPVTVQEVPKIPETKLEKQRSFVADSKTSYQPVKAPEESKPACQSQPKTQWKDRARRSNTIALLEASSDAPTTNKLPWQPKLDVKSETDRKLQELFKRNADQSNEVTSYRPRAPVQSKFSNLKKTFESQPSQEQLSRRSSADTTEPRPHVTSGHLKVQIHSNEIPLNRVFIPAPHPLAESKPSNVFVHHEQPQPIHVKMALNGTSSGDAHAVPPELRLRMAQVSSARSFGSQQDIRIKPEVRAPLTRDKSTEYVSAVTYSQSINPALRTKPEVPSYPVARNESSDSIRMTMRSENVRSSSTGRNEVRRHDEPLVGRITVQPQPVKTVQSRPRRMMRNRSCSSVVTQSSLRSDSKDTDDDKDSIGIIGDDEASSSDDSSSDDEPVRPKHQKQADGLKTLSKILKKHSDEPPNPPMAPLIIHPPVEDYRSNSVSKSYSSRELRSASGSLDEYQSYGISRAMSSTSVRPSLPLASVTSEVLPYVEPEGPTLVGLVAKNVARRSSSSNSLHSNSLHPSPTAPELPFVSRSVSSSRLVTEAKHQLERRDARPKSLVIPSPTEVRKMQTVGSKQYEASLSPESAEKKQREVMAFFGQNQMRQQQYQQQCQQQMMFSASCATAVRSSSAAPVMMVNPAVARLVRSEKVPLNRQSSFDGSDVDEVFNRILADNPPTPDVRLSCPQYREQHSSSSREFANASACLSFFLLYYL